MNLRSKFFLNVKTGGKYVGKAYFKRFKFVRNKQKFGLTGRSIQVGLTGIYIITKGVFY